MDGVIAGKAAVQGGKEVKTKASNTNLAASGVLGQRRVNVVASSKDQPTVKAGAKRPALGNISNSGVKVSCRSTSATFLKHALTLACLSRTPMSIPTFL